ncbi:MAG: hypothetical protein CVU84_10900 [Firmicutes bacterium HGW-Firmicutes-1]|jgi:uncharacterized protein YjdB|nr:MAG: hypothetical protein CVU84_10900 [Firmicutes bacterium HGW-Firmicutes-1]
MKTFFNKPFALVLCLLMLFSMITAFGATKSNDYISHWANKTIESALTSGIATGYTDGSFKPDNAITRAEFFQLVNNQFAFSVVSGTTFTDVASDTWYANVVSKANAAGYISGYPDGSIHPQNNITRQEVAVIISSLKSLTAASNILSFSDQLSIDSWSKQAIIAVSEAKIMIGYPDGSFRSEALITRAEALLTITRAFHHVPGVVVVDVNAITVSQDTMTLSVAGMPETIIASVTPTNSTNKNIIWTSSDEDIANVAGGIVTPIAVGTTIITATSAADETKTASTIVTVASEVSENQNTISPINLGEAGNYAILSKTGISSVPNSVVIGNMGVSPIDSTGITGFSLTLDATNLFSTSAQVTGKIYASSYAAPTTSNLTTAISNMETAYTEAAGRTVNYTELYSGDLSGKTLTSGVYKWGTGVLINSDVTLHGGANDVFIFQISEGLTQANGVKIILTGGAQDKNIFWQTAETVAIGTNAHFEGNILSMTNITLGTNASINGRLLAQTAVTLDASIVVAP